MCEFRPNSLLRREAVIRLTFVPFAIKASRIFLLKRDGECVAMWSSLMLVFLMWSSLMLVFLGRQPLHMFVKVS